MEETVYPIFVMLLGLCLGSFATALSYRVPRGISMIRKVHSCCPSCGHNLGVFDLIPFFSWLFLRGKCRYCKARIGIRYPLIEFATMLLCMGFYYIFGAYGSTVAMFFSAPILVAMMDIDLKHKILPDSLNLALLVIGGIALSMMPHPDWTRALLGAAVYGGGSFLLRYIFLLAMKKEALGLGDVKFFAATGLWLGTDIQKMALYLILAGMLGALMGVFWKKATKDPEFPFGPALIVSFIIVLFSYSDRF